MSIVHLIICICPLRSRKIVPECLEKDLRIKSIFKSVKHLLSSFVILLKMLTLFVRKLKNITFTEFHIEFFPISIEFLLLDYLNLLIVFYKLMFLLALCYFKSYKKTLLGFQFSFFVSLFLKKHRNVLFL